MSGQRGVPTKATAGVLQLSCSETTNDEREGVQGLRRRRNDFAVPFFVLGLLANTGRHVRAIVEIPLKLAMVAKILETVVRFWQDSYAAEVLVRT